MIQKLIRIKKIGPSASDPFGDYDKLVIEVSRVKPETVEQAAQISPSEVKYFLRASDRATGLADKLLDRDQLMRVFEDNIGFDSEAMIEE